MNTLVIFAALIATGLARPGQQLVSVSQDTLGNYNLQYAIDGIARTENRDIHGNVNGGFSYFDPHGILRKTEFTSGVHGFNAVGTDIPLPVADTPEVALAKAEHLSVLQADALAPKIPEFQDAYSTGLLEVPLVRAAPVAVAPVSVAAAPIVHAPVAHAPFLTSHHHLGHVGIAETPEVIAAKAEHFAAHAAARANLLLH